MITVIIPAFEEEGHIGKLVRYLKTEAVHPGFSEILIVDGNSRDRTVREAEDAGAHVIVTSKKGRACQMNKGARHARGSVFFFLHADTFPPETFAGDILGAVSRGKQAGCFRLSFDDPHIILRLYGWFTRFDINVFRYGDQGLFITKELFETAGGFDESLLVMEDNEIIRRIKNLGNYFIIPKKVVTSARKYRDNGVIRLQLVFVLIFIMFNLGVSQERLVRVYKRLIES
ncbi:MAG: TIGR04283 family arsenosugar biosynthesis glycosyltransferase [Balneolales bacterium]